MLVGLQEVLTEVMVEGLAWGGVLLPPPPQPAAHRPPKRNRTRAVLDLVRGLVLGLMHIPFTSQDAKGKQLEGYRSAGLFIETL
jgi:hypothetical protein